MAVMLAAWLDKDAELDLSAIVVNAMNGERPITQDPEVKTENSSFLASMDMRRRQSSDSESETSCKLVKRKRSRSPEISKFEGLVVNKNQSKELISRILRQKDNEIEKEQIELRRERIAVAKSQEEYLARLGVLNDADRENLANIVRSTMQCDLSISQTQESVISKKQPLPKRKKLEFPETMFSLCSKSELQKTRKFWKEHQASDYTDVPFDVFMKHWNTPGNQHAIRFQEWRDQQEK